MCMIAKLYKENFTLFLSIYKSNFFKPLYDCLLYMHNALLKYLVVPFKDDFVLLLKIL